MKLKMFSIFSRTRSVPGGSTLGAIGAFRKGPFTVKSDPALAIKMQKDRLEIPARLKSTPLPLVFQSRVVYRVYLADQAIVYSGIDLVRPAKYHAAEIIQTIVGLEGIHPFQWSFYDLLTSRQCDEMRPGQYEYNAVFLRLGIYPLAVEGGALTDCPAVVARDFRLYIGWREDEDDDSPEVEEIDHDDDEEQS